MKCDNLTAYKGDVTIPVYGTFADAEVYLKKDVDAAIAELKEFAEDACIERDDNQTAIDELQAENAELKQKLESVQASMYADVVDANMEIRRLKHALWIARAKSAENAVGEIHNVIVCMRERNPKMSLSNTEAQEQVWKKVASKCLKKAEEYR